MAIKYIHVRFPGREMIHLVPPGELEIDERFGEGQFIAGLAKTLCGKWSESWTLPEGMGQMCQACAAKRLL